MSPLRLFASAAVILGTLGPSVAAMLDHIPQVELGAPDWRGWRDTAKQFSNVYWERLAKASQDLVASIPPDAFERARYELAAFSIDELARLKALADRAQLSVLQLWTLLSQWDVGWVEDQAGQTALAAQNVVTLAWAQVPRDGRWWTDFGVTTAVITTTVGTSTATCIVVASPAGPIVMSAAGTICAIGGQYGGGRLVKAGYAFFEQPLNLEAYRAGEFTGAMLGGVVGALSARQLISWNQMRQYADYGGYAAEARRLTAQNLRPFSERVTVWRSGGMDLDHIVPVKCGWQLGWTAAQIASPSNMQGLPSAINRSIGAKGC